MARGDSQRTPESESEQRHPFAMDAWKYGRKDIDTLIRELSGGDRKSSKELKEMLARGGGKAFGLALATRIARNLKDVAYHLSVPPWKIIPDVTSFEPAKIDYQNILRSSSSEEDWLDPRSGVLPSFDFAKAGMMRFRTMKEYGKLPECPYLLQESRHGWGVVADIAYSPVFKKVVAKIAYGNTRRADEIPNSSGHYTSATTDTEASVGIWEAETGLPLLPTVNFGHTSAQPDNLLYQNTFAPKLFSAVKKTGISFGVQLELVMDPRRPLDLSLVQVRPTPERVYKKIKTEQKRTAEAGIQTQCLSPIVNAAFDVIGTAEFFGSAGIDKNMEAGRSSRHSGNWPRTGEGKVGLYDKKRGRDAWIGKYYSAPDIFYGGYLNGAEVQLTSHAIRPNTHHGTEDMSPQAIEIYDTLDTRCGMVFLRAEEIAALKDLLSSRASPQLRVVSDGLAAQIIIVD